MDAVIDRALNRMGFVGPGGPLVWRPRASQQRQQQMQRAQVSHSSLPTLLLRRFQDGCAHGPSAHLPRRPPPRALPDPRMAESNRRENAGSQAAYPGPLRGTF